MPENNGFKIEASGLAAPMDGRIPGRVGFNSSNIRLEPHLGANCSLAGISRALSVLRDAPSRQALAGLRSGFKACGKSPAGSDGRTGGAARYYVGSDGGAGERNGGVASNDGWPDCGSCVACGAQSKKYAGWLYLPRTRLFRVTNRPVSQAGQAGTKRWRRDSLHIARARKETADFANFADMMDDHDEREP